MNAFERRDSARLAELVHPHAIIEPRPSPRPLNGPRAVTSYIESMRTRVAAVSVTSIQELSDDSLLIEGREQWQADDHSLFDSPVVWVLRLRDGLIWRTRTYANRHEALDREARMPNDPPSSSNEQ